MAKTPRIAALGYYGFGNLGDEAVLAGIRTGLREVMPDHRFLALTADAAETRRLHPGVETVNRWSWRDVFAALRGTDLFVFGGGSLLQDATSVSSVVWYALMALMTRRRSRRMLWWAQGIGPLNSPMSRRFVCMIANQADAITVRDKKSAELLKVIGVRGSIRTVADPAFALAPSTTISDSRLSAPILLALRAWRNEAAGDLLMGREGASLLGEGTTALPMHLPDDADYGRAKNPALPLYDWRARSATPEQVLGLVAQSDLMVAMRLHALIFAARVGVPFVALSYDPKVDALALAAGQGDVVLPVAGLDRAAMADALLRVRANRAERQAALKDFARDQGAKARIPAGIARQLLEN